MSLKWGIFSRKIVLLWTKETNFSDR